ncbi:MAG: hypothetical protein RR865_14710, partial [Clostridia bacterium]
AGVSRTNFSNDIDGKPVSDRFIKNMRIEIPLPPNVTFVSSEYSVGDGKNGTPNASLCCDCIHQWIR